MIINIEPDVVYNFLFKAPFNIFDNKYRVREVLSYDEFTKLNIDLFKTLYEPVGKTQNELNDNLSIYRKNNILKLCSPNVTIRSDLEKLNEKIYYFPFDLCKQAPDPNIKEYPNLAIAMNIGPIDNPDKLTSLRQSMYEHILAATGVDKKIDLVAINTVWLTEQEYQDIENSRDQSSKKVINYFTETQQLIKIINTLNAKLETYEKAFLENVGP